MNDCSVYCTTFLELRHPLRIRRNVDVILELCNNQNNKHALKKTSKSGDGEQKKWSSAENHTPTLPLNLLLSCYRNIAGLCPVIGELSCTDKQ